MGLAGAARPARARGAGATKAFLLVGALAHSGRWRGVLAESTDQPHLIDGAAPGLRRGLGGLTRGLAVRPDGHGLPPRHAAGSPPRSPRSPSTTGCRWRSARRGAGTARAWWRRPTTPPRNAGGAPWPTTSPSSRPRPAWTGSPACAATPGCAPPPTARSTVATVAAAEPLRRCRRRRSRPILTVPRTASRAGAGLLPRQPLLGATRAGPRPRSPSRTGSARASIEHRHQRRDRHRPAPPGRRPGPASPSATPARHRPGTRRDGRVHHRARRTAARNASHPGPAARAAAAALRASHAAPTPSTTRLTPSADADVVIDLAAYAAAAQGRNTLP